MKKNYIKVLLIFLIVAFQEPAAAQNIFKKLSVAKCDSLIKANETNPDFVILDVRTENSWESSHLEGSICRNFYDSNFNDQLDALPKHKTFLVHCQSGGRSGQAFSTMQTLGFSEVYDMQGGMSAWKSSGYSSTSVIEPKLMLVDYQDLTSEEYNSEMDSIKITVTNRSNGILSFSSSSFSDVHNISSDFEKQTELEGAEDYTFFIFHSPGYFETDTTGILLESNGGTIDVNIVFKNGTIQSTEELQLPEILVYPNPANQLVNIKTSDGKPAEKIILTNLNGKVLLMTQYQKSLDISGIKNGLYILGIECEGNLKTKKLLIKH